MKGTITLKIVAAPNTKTEVLVEHTDAVMPAREIKTFEKIVEYIQTEIDRLNNAKDTQPQNTWKPSDKQIEALKQAKTDACGKPYFNALASLYVNLKRY